MLNTFQLVDKNRVISPILTTTREYGNWLETVFDNSICQIELYIPSIKEDGKKVLEKHPGTKIGNYFDKASISNSEYKSWFILEESKCIDKLVRLKLAEKRDTVPTSVYDIQKRRMLRCYTLNQLELYIRTMIDPKFQISEYVSTPKQVKVDDMKYIITQKIQSKKKRLF